MVIEKNMEYEIVDGLVVSQDGIRSKPLENPHGQHCTHPYCPSSVPEYSSSCTDPHINATIQNAFVKLLSLCCARLHCVDQTGLSAFSIRKCTKKCTKNVQKCTKNCLCTFPIQKCTKKVK